MRYYLAIDTWGVDYVLMKGDEEIRPCYAYRDWRTEAVHGEVHARMAFTELYRRTGIQCYSPRGKISAMEGGISFALPFHEKGEPPALLFHVLG